jgi:transposase-like protein
MRRGNRKPSSTLSAKLRHIRTLLGLAEGEMTELLGQSLGLVDGDVRDYERGRREPPLAVLLRYARVAGLPLDVLADDELDLPARLPTQAAPQEGQCPYCRATDAQVKDGYNGSGAQRYRCQHCRRRYTPRPRPFGHPDALRQKAIRLQQGGMSPWAISKEIGVSHQTVINWVRAHYSRGVTIGRGKPLGLEPTSKG